MKYNLYLDLKKNNGMSCELYVALHKYAQCYQEDDDIVPENIFNTLYELVEMFRIRSVSDIIEYVNQELAYKEAFIAAYPFLDSERFSDAFLIQVYCLIEAGDHIQVELARNRLEDWISRDSGLREFYSKDHIARLSTKECFNLVRNYIENKESLSQKAFKIENMLT